MGGRSTLRKETPCPKSSVLATLVVRVAANPRGSTTVPLGEHPRTEIIRGRIPNPIKTCRSMAGGQKPEKRRKKQKTFANTARKPAHPCRRKTSPMKGREDGGKKGENWWEPLITKDKNSYACYLIRKGGGFNPWAVSGMNHPAEAKGL